ncbi:MAG: hypothetical protein IH964_03980 [Candidatus Dadabacteria bacterium]|jgi:hypothetical protein|nr:hypothetical protein [Candidatus Dadabacteria bacterium]
MYTINRSIAIIRPKQPFVDWANQLPDAELKSSLDDFKTDCLAILIPDYDTDEEAEGYINEIYEDIFIEELYGWCTEEAWFPQDRTNEMFWQWFEVELHSIVMDSCMEPIEEEEQ